MLIVQSTVFIWIITWVRTHHCMEDEKKNQHKGGGTADAHIKSGRQNGCLKNCKVQTKALPIARHETQESMGNMQKLPQTLEPLSPNEW